MQPPLLESAALFLPTHREPELEQVQATANEVALELGRLPHELAVLLVRAEAHHAFDSGAVVPGAIEHGDFAACRQVLHIALEIPLPSLDIAGFLERHDARTTRVQVLHEALDRAALAGRIATFEQYDDAFSGLLHPGLQFQQLDLQPVLLLFVVIARHQVPVGVPAGAPVFHEFGILPILAGEPRDLAVAAQQFPHCQHVVR